MKAELNFDRKFMVVGTSHGNGDVVIKRGKVGRWEFDKTFQRATKNPLSNAIFRAYDVIVGNKNVSSYVESKAIDKAEFCGHQAELTKRFAAMIRDVRSSENKSTKLSLIIKENGQQSRLDGFLSEMGRVKRQLDTVSVRIDNEYVSAKRMMRDLAKISSISKEERRVILSLYFNLGDRSPAKAVHNFRKLCLSDSMNDVKKDANLLRAFSRISDAIQSMDFSDIQDGVFNKFKDHWLEKLEKIGKNSDDAKELVGQICDALGILCKDPMNLSASQNALLSKYQNQIFKALNDFDIPESALKDVVLRAFDALIGAQHDNLVRKCQKNFVDSRLAIRALGGFRTRYEAVASLKKYFKDELEHREIKRLCKIFFEETGLCTSEDFLLITGAKSIAESISKTDPDSPRAKSLQFITHLEKMLTFDAEGLSNDTVSKELKEFLLQNRITSPVPGQLDVKTIDSWISVVETLRLSTRVLTAEDIAAIKALGDTFKAISISQRRLPPPALAAALESLFVRAKVDLPFDDRDLGIYKKPRD